MPTQPPGLGHQPRDGRLEPLARAQAREVAGGGAEVEEGREAERAGEDVGGAEAVGAQAAGVEIEGAQQRLYEALGCCFERDGGGGGASGGGFRGAELVVVDDARGGATAPVGAGIGAGVGGGG